MLRSVSRFVFSRRILYENVSSRTSLEFKFKRYYSEKKKTDTEQEQPRPKKAKSKEALTLLSSVEKFLLHAPAEKQKNAEPFIHRRLKEDRFHTPERPLILENLISLLIHHRRFKEAGTVYQRLSNEGHQSSHRTDAQMLAMGLASSPESTDTILESLDLIFGTEEFTEDDFVLLMGMYKDLDLSPGLSIHTIQRFIACRGEEYVPHLRVVNLLAGLLVNEGRVSEAFEIVDHFDAMRKEDDPSRAQPYISMISSLDAFDPLSLQSIDDVLDTIRRKEIQIDNSLVNTLIAKQTRAGAIDRAFELYHALVDTSKENSSIYPDFFTYRNLFRLLLQRKTRPPTPAPSPTTPEVDEKDLVPPRQLYLSMLSSHFNASRKNSKRTLQVDLDQDQSILHVSLQTFLAYHDYSAAYVTIRAFADFGIPVTVKTYGIVFTHVSRRVRDSIQSASKTGGSSWANRMLGFVPTDFRGMGEFLKHGEGGGGKAKSIKERIMRKVLWESQRPGLVPSNEGAGAVPARTRKQRRGATVVPSYSMLVNETPPPPLPYAVLDLKPLERTLRRALLAELEERQPLIGRIGEVGRSIEDARKEMIPSDVELRPRRSLFTHYIKKEVWL